MKGQAWWLLSGCLTCGAPMLAAGEGVQTQKPEYALYVGYILPSDVEDARNLESKCIGPRAVCKQSCRRPGQDAADSDCLRDCELAFRVCISGIRAARFWLATCPMEGECRTVTNLVPLSPEEAVDPDLNYVMPQIQPHRYAETGLYVVVETQLAVVLSGKVCTFRRIAGDEIVSFRGQEYVCQALKNHRDKPGVPLLSVAIEEGQDGLMEFLLKRGINVNEGGDLDCPLSTAVRRGRWHVVRQLIAHDANVDRRAYANGETVLYKAVDNGDFEMVRLLVEKGANIDRGGFATPLTTAVENKNMAMVEWLLTNGADVNRAGSYTPLGWAVLNNHLEMATFLIEKGASVEKEGNGPALYYTPLQIAAAKGYLSMANLLLRHGANVNSFDIQEFRSPLYWAAREGQTEMVRNLIAHGAKVDTNRAGNTMYPLHAAAWGGHAAIVEILLARGARVDRESNESVGGTPLHLAAGSGHLPAVKVLLAHGADVNHKFRGWYTPLHLAARGGYLEAVKTLVAHGARVGEQDSEGKTALDLAQEDGHQDVVAFLRSLRP